MKVTFFGHRTIPSGVPRILENVIQDLLNRGATEFFVGHHGDFDRAATKILRRLREERSDFNYWVVLSQYPPKEKEELPYLFPEGMERSLPRFAIDMRNRWMLKQADVVVVYAPYPGNAKNWKERALKAKKEVIECSDIV